MHNVGKVIFKNCFLQSFFVFIVIYASFKGWFCLIVLSALFTSLGKLVLLLTSVCRFSNFDFGCFMKISLVFEILIALYLQGNTKAVKSKEQKLDNYIKLPFFGRIKHHLLLESLYTLQYISHMRCREK